MHPRLELASLEDAQRLGREIGISEAQAGRSAFRMLANPDLAKHVFGLLTMLSSRNSERTSIADRDGARDRQRDDVLAASSVAAGFNRRRGGAVAAGRSQAAECGARGLSVAFLSTSGGCRRFRIRFRAEAWSTSAFPALDFPPM